jgi:RNA polymerase sigma-54 factor
MDLHQRPELRHKITLSPQVYQGLSILAMPVAELQVLVETELLENPVLEVEEFEDLPEEAQEERSDEGDEDRSWDEWLDRYEELASSEPVIPRDPDVEVPDTEEYVGSIQSFGQYLEQQLAMVTLTEDEARAARAVVGSLDDDGFFCVKLEEIATVAGVSLDVALRGLEVVQQLDPPGVGARNLAEALRIQLDYLGIDEPLLVKIAESHLDDVAGNHFRKIARSLRVDEAEVRRLVEILRMLNPRPAGAFSPGPSPGYIVPDVTLRRFDEGWTITPNTEAVPTLRINTRYRSMLRDGSGADADTVRYLKDHIRSAEAFIRNVDRRKDTVSRIAEIVLEAQRDAPPLAARRRGRGGRCPLVYRESGRHGEVHGDSVRDVRAEALLLRRLPHRFGDGCCGHHRQAASQGVARRRRGRAPALRSGARRSSERGGDPGGSPHDRQVPRGARYRTLLGKEAALDGRGSA